MVTLHAHLTVLSDVYSAVSYAHDRNSGGLFQDTAGLGTANIVPILGALIRVHIWEIIVLKNGLTAEGVTVPPKLESEQQSAFLPNVGGRVPVGLMPLALDVHPNEDKQKQ